jgi:ATP-dependent Clp protease ATP-binding subunit ClpC
MSSNNALTAGAQQLIEAALDLQRQQKHDQITVQHWLLALVERYGPMAESLTTDLDSAALKRYLRDQMRQNASSTPLSEEDLVSRATAYAQSRGKDRVGERDLAAIILEAANYKLLAPSTTVTKATKTTSLEGSTPPTPSDGGAEPTTKGAPAEPASAKPPQGTAGTPQPAPSRALRPTPLLEQFGRDLTREARDGKLPTVVGREAEVQLMVETLCRTTKRNPVLVGPAGSGKTAIVEGLAQRIVSDDVPQALRGSRLLAIQPSTLVAGAGVVGELEKRMKGLLSEASQDGILLFIDEVHSIIGAGGAPGSSDMASLLKPVLARGEIACIAATTDDEYRRFIEQDAALERRFQPIRVQEMTPEQTFTVLTALRDTLASRRGVSVDDAILRWLVEFAQRYLRNRHFPDKAVDLLEQCVAYAITQGRDSVTLAEAEAVAQRLIGMPLAIEDRLGPLKQELITQALLAPSDVESLIGRLEVTLRGLDLRSSRPNATLLLLDEAAAISEALAGVLAIHLFGAADRVIGIDFSRFVHPADVTMLIGAPPGYVGYSESLPLHRLIQMPWSVVRCENIHACHPQVLVVFLQALATGVLTDARGRKLYLSDTIVIMTAGVGIETNRSIGFQQAEAAKRNDARRSAVEVFGEDLIDLADLVVAEVPLVDAAQRHFLTRLLADLGERYRAQGLTLTWDESLVDWLATQQDATASQLDWERLVDERVSPQLIRNIPPTGEQRALSVSYLNGGIMIAELQSRGTAKPTTNADQQA